MVKATGANLESLTLRERDCLRLLAKGMGTADVARRLGISSSTFNKHLASVRQKLAVDRTVHALLLYQRQAEIGTHPQLLKNPAVDAVASRSVLLSDFITSVANCVTFDEAWTVLQDYLRVLGIEHFSCGIVAEPPGQYTNGARCLKGVLPGNFEEMYGNLGVAEMDPTVQFFAYAKRPIHIENKVLIAKAGKEMPKVIRAFGEGLVDNDCNHEIIVPTNDALTEAPLGLEFFLPTHGIDDYLRQNSPKLALLEVLGRVFVDFIQARHLLCDVPGLSIRQKEALSFTARGFTADEAAEQMGVSRRFFERTLAGARQKLGARTTAAAVFRAVVYRVLI